MGCRVLGVGRVCRRCWMVLVLVVVVVVLVVVVEEEGGEEREMEVWRVCVKAVGGGEVEVGEMGVVDLGQRGKRR